MIVRKVTKEKNEDIDHQNNVLGEIDVGYTGTRKGMTLLQLARIEVILDTLTVVRARHGDCIGGDEEFHELCITAEIPIEIHPPDNDRLRAFCKGAVKVHEPKPFIKRNHIIVNTCDLLIAAPKETYEPAPARGQGTWSTVRYARKLDRLLRIVWPE